MRTILKRFVMLGLVTVVIQACTTWSLAPYVECRDYIIHVDTLMVQPDSIDIFGQTHYTSFKVDSVTYQTHNAPTAEECNA
jgi:hypothetical protein